VERGLASFERIERRLGGHGLIGYLVVAVLVAVALVIYFVGASDLAARGTWFVIGEASGIAAATLLALVVLLAARVRPLEWLFGDLSRVYVSHAILGMAIFALISVHPLLYVTGTLPAGARAAAHVIVPFHLVVLDWISYILIATALVFTLYLRPAFATWRLTHLLLGAAMVLTGYSILIDNHSFDTFEIPALRIYLFVLFGLSTAAFIWVAAISRYLDPKREYEVTDVTRHPEARAVEIRARPVGKRLAYNAGQFAGVDLLDDRLQINRDFEAHPFSITTAPEEDGIGLVIEATGDATERIQRIAGADGARALIHSPHGRLSDARPRRGKQLWIGGGIGITPFLSLASGLALHPEGYGEHDVTLIATVDRREQAFYWDRLRDCAERSPALDVKLWTSEERGTPTAEGLSEWVDGDLSDRLVLLCGPDAMIGALEEGFLAAGVPRGNIRWERAIGPPDSWRAAAPAMRTLRVIATAAASLFATLVLISTVGRAVTNGDSSGSHAHGAGAQPSAPTAPHSPGGRP
jgi:predicted ferric reductase